MSDAALKTPQLVHEDRYFEALEAFLRTSADYLEVYAQMPGQGVTRLWYERAAPVETLR